MANDNSKEYILALDLGKYDGKAIGRAKDDSSEDIKKVKLRTKIKVLGENEFVEIGSNSHNLIYDKNNIVIGEQGEEIEENFKSNKISVLHKYIAYGIITKFLKPNTTGNKIKAVLACPIPMLNIIGSKDEYKQLIKGDGPINVEVDGQKFEFEITDIMVKAEDSCIIYTPELAGIDNVGIIGFGGLNMNFLLYNKGEFVFRKSYDHGSKSLKTFIKDSLTIMKGGELPTEYELDMAFEKGYIFNKGKIVEESIEAVNDAKKKFLKEAQIMLLKDKQDINALEKLCFIGGTSIKLKNQIAELYDNIVKFKNDEDLQMAAVEGLYRVAVKKYLK
ncbi:recombinase [Clostridium botulinum]|uniref:ParM/StbA family protein n=1 Tax=Clostridium botulinum TaxID=1491 RepID=UPI001788E277|nr:recombinase [Clostridium botulinum]MBE1306150.1 recombinase [Clostridium botulinum]